MTRALATTSGAAFTTSRTIWLTSAALIGSMSIFSFSASARKAVSFRVASKA